MDAGAVDVAIGAEGVAGAWTRSAWRRASKAFALSESVEAPGAAATGAGAAAGGWPRSAWSKACRALS